MIGVPRVRELEGRSTNIGGFVSFATGRWNHPPVPDRHDQLRSARARPASRPLLSGKCVIVEVRIDVFGQATAVIEHADANVDGYFLRGILENATQSWTPANDEFGDRVSDVQRISYCWP